MPKYAELSSGDLEAQAVSLRAQIENLKAELRIVNAEREKRQHDSDAKLRWGRMTDAQRAEYERIVSLRKVQS